MSKKIFEPLQHKCISDEVVDIFISRIQNGLLRIGDKLPPERVLCEELCISRTTLRLALRTLENMGFLRCVACGGNYINQVSVENVITPFSNMMKQDKTLAADIIEVRKHMETYMASLAAKQATKEENMKIYGAIINMQIEVSAGGNGIVSDNQFHMEIARASKNKAFIIIVESIAELLHESRLATLSIPGQPEKTIDDHMRIYSAIRDRDEKRAEREMLEHLTKAHDNVQKIISA